MRNNAARLKRISVAAAAILFGVAPCAAEAPLGERPAYATRELTPIPSAQALERSLWLPGLHDGYVPQGIVLLDDRLFVTGYRSTDRAQDRGPCRLFAVDARTGKTLGYLDLPETCGHAGGLMKSRNGGLIVSDTRIFYEIELAPRGSETIGKVIRTISIAGEVRGSFCASEADGFWLGRYAREDTGMLFKFPWEALDRAEISNVDAIAQVRLPPLSQGAAFDAAGDLWVMQSGSKTGELVKLERNSGAILARFPMPVGAEGISFAPDGSLWTLSEAGSQRWYHWEAFYPLALRFDMNRLR